MSELFDRIERSIISGRARHAYLLTGNDPLYTTEAARGLASVLLYGTKDLARLSQDADHVEVNGSIPIGRFRDEIQPEIYRETFGGRRTAAFLSADQLSQMVQNAMLKVLEEPPENTYFILTGNEYGILPTIRSRCTVVRCPMPDLAQIKRELIARGADADTADSLARQSGCVSGRALRLLDDEAFAKMRKELYSAFIAALCGRPDFRFCRAKRERTDWAEATELLLLFAHDMLRSACGDGAEYCTDFASEIKKLCTHFTIGDIGCIIDLITEAARRTATNASGGAVFDKLFADVALLSGTRR